MHQPDLSSVIALMNSHSGERASAVFLQDELNRLLPGRVIDLMTQIPDNSAALELIRSKGANGTLIIAGGDGTVSWGMDLVDASGLADDAKPHISVIPMGTGNDLSRALRFGPGFSKEKCCCGCCSCCRVNTLDETITTCVTAPKSTMDRWNIDVTGLNGTPVLKKVMNNYFSIGFDAHIAKKFDTMRRENPGCFQSRQMNKMWYGCLGCRALCGEPKLYNFVSLVVDGKKLDIPEDIKSLVVANVDSFAGGTQLWKDSQNKFKPVSVSDGLLEITGIYGSFHMGMIQGKLRNGVKIAQGSTIEITCSEVAFMQWDGEPMDAVRENGTGVTIKIDHHSSPKVLNNRLREEAKK